MNHNLYDCIHAHFYVGLRCVAFNDHGVITSEPFRLESNGVRAVANGGERVDNTFLFSAINQARRDVELAENDSVSALFGHMERTGIKLILLLNLVSSTCASL